MKCNIPIELLNGYLDGELEEQELKRVEKHLKDCQSCRNMLNELALIDKYIKAQEFEEPSREFIFGLKRRIIEKVRKKPRSFIFRYTPVFAPAAVALLILVIVINFPQQKQSIGINDRILYVEITPRRELELQIPEPKLAEMKKKEMKFATKAGKIAEVPVASASVERSKAHDEAEKALGVNLDDAAMLDIPSDRITRVIIDSTGKVLKVATGNSILPEKDTVLENRLQGQQLTPPMVAGRRQAQMYVDLTQTAKSNSH